MRSVEEWDEQYILGEVAQLPESENVERKESAKVKDRETIAKSVCAFANAGDGVLVFGFRDAKSGGGFDDGVEQLNGREPIDSWVNAIIPKLHHPPIDNCRARFIPISGLGPGRGVLAVQVPLSDRRPHWSTQGPKEVAYLRVGEHSAPMRLQTLLDISTRGTACVGEIGKIEIGRSVDFMGGGTPPAPIGITAVFRVSGGPICRTWAVEIILETPVEHETFYSDPEHGSVDNVNGQSIFLKHGDEPLFPRRWFRLRPVSMLLKDSGENRKITVRLFLESSVPVQSSWAFVPVARVGGEYQFEVVPLTQNRIAPLD